MTEIVTLRCLHLTPKKKIKCYGSNNLLHEQFSKRNQGFCKRLSCQMSFTNVHNEFKTKLRKTGGDFIVHSSDFTLYSSQFILHSSHFTLPSFLKWLNIYREIRKTSKFRLHSSYVTVHTSHFTVHTSHFTLHRSHFIVF